MNAADLITELRELGVHLWADDDKLRYRAPSGVLTEDRRTTLIEHKDDVLQLLQQETALPQVEPDLDARHEAFPLTPVQTAYLIGRQRAYDYGGIACTSYLEVEFENIEPVQIEQAWNTLIRDHDMLRAVVHADGYQRILPDVEDYSITTTDMRAATGATLQDHLDDCRSALTAGTGDPAEWPLFALHATRTDQGTILHLSVELLVIDATSLQALLHELDTRLQQSTAPGPPTSLSFRDYVMAEQRLHTSPQYQRDRQYWLDRLPTLPAAPELPTHEIPEATTPLAFDRLSRWLTPDELAGLRTRAKNHKVTVSAIVLAAYAEVIGRWSRHRQFTLNLPLFNRLPLHPDVDTLIGDFTSVDLLSIDLDAQDSFAARTQAISAQLFDDLDHRLFTGIDVLAELTRRAGHPALMPIVFTSTAGMDTPEAASMSGRIRRGLTSTPQVWIDCQVTEHAGTMMLGWDVRRGVLDDAVTQQAFTAFTDLVVALAKEDITWQEQYPVPLPIAQQTRREETNATTVDRQPRRLHTAVLDQALTTPDAPAILSDGKVVSYRQLASAASAVSEKLLLAGCMPSDHIAVHMDKGPEQVIAVLGILQMGAVYVPVDTAQPQARRQRIVDSASIRVALVKGDDAAHLPVTAITVQVTDTPTTTVVDPHLATDAPAYVIYTSGSTGDPKGVAVSHQAAANTLDAINDRFAITASDRVLGIAHLGFDLSVWDIFGVLATGGALVLPDPARGNDPSHWAELIDEHQVTLWNTVPAQLQMLQDYADSNPDCQLSSLRLALLSGDWIPVELPDRVRAERPGLQVVSLGGATEAAIWSICYPIEDIDASWRSIPYGTPLDNQTFHVLNDALQECPDHVTGELYIGGHGLADGYLSDPDRTQERFFIHPRTGRRLYRTGDTGRYLPDGTIEFLGREDTQVKLRGHRVELGEIESAMRAHPAVADAAAITTGERQSLQLAGFAETATATADDHPPATPILDAAIGTAAAIEDELDTDAFTELMHAVDDVAVLSIALRLRDDGLFIDDEAAHTLADIGAATGIAERQSGLLRRWMSALVTASAVQEDDDGRYRGLIAATPSQVQVAWDRIDALDAAIGYGPDTLAYIRTCSCRLEELLDGTLDVRELLFPDGEIGAANAVYKDNLVGHSIHRIVISTVRSILGQHSGPARVLEVGAGIAGTSSELIPALAEFEPDYLFTDISEFFLSTAREKFHDYPWVRYGRFDINLDARSQGFTPNSADVILCANVLHNSRNANEVLARLKEILAPGGWLVFIEPTKQHNYPLLVSMEFEFFSELTRFTDSRKDTDQAFFARQQWLEMLTAAGAEYTLCLPPLCDALAASGQGAFLARFGTDHRRITSEDLTAHLAAQLPTHMIPPRLEVVDALPRTTNGKTDRATLATWATLDVKSATSGDVEELTDALEESIAALWKDMLGIDHVGRSQDFYSLGGDSLLLSRMVGRLRETVPEAHTLEWQELLRHMLRDATVRGLAACLRGATVVEETSTASGADTVPLNTPREPTAETWVLVHGGSGTLQPYQPLLPQLRDAHPGPLIGLEISDFERYLTMPPETVVHRLAADYARELLATGARRFRIIGYCVGGLLASEIARTLTESGAHVNDLTVISSYRPPEVHDQLMVEYVFALAMGTDLAAAGMPADTEACNAAIRSILDETPEAIPDGALSSLDGGFGSVGEEFRAYARQSADERLAALHHASTAEAAYNPGTYSLEEFRRYFAVFRQSMQAVSQHRLDPYLGPTTLLRNSESSTLLPGTRADVGAFWTNICIGHLAIHDVPGDHFNCMSARNAPTLAALLSGGAS